MLITCILSTQVLIVLSICSKPFEWLPTAFQMKNKSLIFRGPSQSNLTLYFQIYLSPLLTHNNVPVAILSAFFFPGTYMVTAMSSSSLYSCSTECSVWLKGESSVKTVGGFSSCEFKTHGVLPSFGYNSPESKLPNRE